MRRTPDAMAIVSAIILIFIGLTWIIPAGEYARIVDPNTGRTVINPDTFTYVKSNPQSILAFFTAPLKGFIKSAEIIGFVFLVGGAFAVFSKTRAMDASLQSLLKFAGDNKQYKSLILFLLVFLFSLAGSTFGMSEEVLVFILITIPLAKSMNYDNIVGVAIPFVGAGAGFAGAFINPFTIQIAQGIAEVPLASGMNYRILVWLAYTIVTGIFIVRYAAKIDKSPELSLIYNIKGASEIKSNEHIDYNLKRKILVFLFLITLALLVIGVKNWDWYISEIAGLFVAFGIFSAIIYQLNINEAFEAFKEGAIQMLPAALIIALSRSILVVAEDGHIIDTILHSIANASEGLPAYISVQLMFFVQGFINFFIPSGSGQAALTMPIMAPLSDVLGITRQTAVLAYQFGDGLFNLIIPTSGITMGVLSIANIPYNLWIKWIWKLIVFLMITSMGFLALATFINYN
ncbi:MAG: Na+/H+ antiporter NhaC family protein [Bacteroidota bacterium]